MTRINTNVSSLTAQKSLARSNVQLQEALTRLSTGLRINSGKDDPAGLIASEILRSNIVSTEKAISNTERANQMIATADSAIGQISSLLNDIRALVTEAANTGALSPDQIAANQLQVDASLESINRIAGTTSFQGQKLIDGSLGFLYTSGAGMTTVTDLQIHQANLGATGSMTVATIITSAATQATITDTIGTGAHTASATVATGDGDLVITTVAEGADQNGITIHWIQDGSVTAGEATAQWDDGSKTLTIKTNTDAAVTAAKLNTAITTATGGAGLFTTDSGAGFLITAPMPADVLTTGGLDGGLDDTVNFTLTGSKGSQVYSFGATTTGTVIAAAVNSNTDATGVSADYAGSTLTFTSSEYGTDATIDIKVNSEGDLGSFASGLSDTHKAGVDIAATVNGFTASGRGNTVTLNTSTLTMQATVDDGSNTAFTFTIDGGGAQFQLGPDVVSTQQARIGISSLNSGTLGGSAGQLYLLGDGNTAALATDPTTAASIVEQAIDEVTTLRGRLGAFQKTTLETNVNALNDTLEALTAAESSIRDADFAEETAKLTRAQILVQSGTAVLQIANQNPQNVLALLR